MKAYNDILAEMHSLEIGDDSPNCSDRCTPYSSGVDKTDHKIDDRRGKHAFDTVVPALNFNKPSSSSSSASRTGQSLSSDTKNMLSKVRLKSDVLHCSGTGASGVNYRPITDTSGGRCGSGGKNNNNAAPSPSSSSSSIHCSNTYKEREEQIGREKNREREKGKVREKGKGKQDYIDPIEFVFHIREDLCSDRIHLVVDRIRIALEQERIELSKRMKQLESTLEGDCEVIVTSRSSNKSCKSTPRETPRETPRDVNSSSGNNSGKHIASSGSSSGRPISGNSSSSSRSLSNSNMYRSNCSSSRTEDNREEGGGCNDSGNYNHYDNHDKRDFDNRDTFYDECDTCGVALGSGDIAESKSSRSQSSSSGSNGSSARNGRRIESGDDGGERGDGGDIGGYGLAGEVLSNGHGSGRSEGENGRERGRVKNLEEYKEAGDSESRLVCAECKARSRREKILGSRLSCLDSNSNININSDNNNSNNMNESSNKNNSFSIGYSSSRNDDSDANKRVSADSAHLGVDHSSASNLPPNPPSSKFRNRLQAARDEHHFIADDYSLR